MHDGLNPCGRVIQKLALDRLAKNRKGGLLNKPYPLGIPVYTGKSLDHPSQPAYLLHFLEFLGLDLQVALQPTGLLVQPGKGDLGRGAVPLPHHDDAPVPDLP